MSVASVSEAEIRMAISRLMQQNRNSSILLLSSGRGRKSTWPPIIEYLLARIVNENPGIRPMQALTFKEHYEALQGEYPVAEMPPDDKIWKKVSAFKTKVYF